jgi:bifunctional oligoribonuclease and PAP phosphatase NrnA
MGINWQPLVSLVAHGEGFLLTTHVRPDGDALGSMLALAGALRQRGKKAQCVISSSYPARYDFLDPQKEIHRFEPPGTALSPFDALIVVDTGTWNQLDAMADFVRQLRVPRLVIDHHVTQDDLGATRLLDTSAEACARLIYEAILALGVKLTQGMAEALFVGLAMDTGWFYHRNTSATTFGLVQELVKAGAQPSYLHEQLFERNTLGRLKLTGLILDRLTVTAGGRIAHSSIHKSDYEQTGSRPPDSEDLINFTMSLAGVEVGLLFMEQLRGGIKISFRSRGQVNMSKLAERFGGGGHPQAAGATVHEPLDKVRADVLAAVLAELPPKT